MARHDRSQQQGSQIDTHDDVSDTIARIEREQQSLVTRVDTLGGVISELVRVLERQVGKLDMIIPKSHVQYLAIQGEEVRNRKRDEDERAARNA